MKLQPYVTKLNSSSEYKTFTKKYDDAFLIAGFFVLDYESGKNLHQIDFYVPSEKKIAAFSLDGGVNVQLLKMLNDKIPEKLDIKTKVDLDALKGILQDEMKNRGITEDVRKIIAILQTVEGKKVWNLNCVLSGMDILRAHIDDNSSSVLKMEKASIFDYIKKMSPEQLASLKDKATTAKANAPAPENVDANTKKKLEQLSKLEEALTKEKEKISAQISKEDKTKKVKKK